MTYLIAKYAFVFILATIAGYFFGRWMTRRNTVGVTESVEDLRGASNETDAAQWERLWRRLDSIQEPKEVSFDCVNERLDALTYAITNLPLGGAPQPAVDAPRSPATGAETTVLKEAIFGKKDNLRLISGIGPKLEQLLNKNGIFYFWQIASWTDSDVELIDERLDAFKGRIGRCGWVPQAERLRRLPGSAQQPTEMRVSA